MGKKTISVASRKAKGRKLQQMVAIKFATKYNLEYGVDEDIGSREMGQSGTDIKMSKHTKGLIPFDIECKNQETWSIPNWWQQCTKNTSDDRKPLLICSKNRHDVLAVLKLDDLLELIQ